MKKLRVVLSGIFYPMAILRFFENALRRNPHIELYTIGPYTKDWIPWKGGMYLDEKYAKSPDYPLHRDMARMGFVVAPEIPFEPDVWIQVDAGFYFSRIPEGVTKVHVATDPHVLDYSNQRTLSDFFFNMQRSYEKSGDIYLPYAFDPDVHFPESRDKVWDACLVGLQYDNRVQTAHILRQMGKSVFIDTGPVFDEYRKIHNESRVCISLSSLDDLIARVFEATAMGIPLVTNPVSDLPLFFEDGHHILTAKTPYEAAEKTMWILDHPEEAHRMALAAKRIVWENHTYDHRINQILAEIDYGDYQTERQTAPHIYT